MSLKRGRLVTILGLVLVWGLLFPANTFGAETYYIDNDRVLLYKIIHWWYDSLPQDDDLLCGSLLRYEKKGRLRIDYDPSQMRLQLHIRGGFAELISIFRTCPTCPGPTRFKSTALNRHHFGKARAPDIPGHRRKIDLLVLENVDKPSMKRLWGAAEDLVLVLTGRIGGLLSGKVSLHPEGKFLKKCPEISEKGSTVFPVTLKLFDAGTGEVLVKYIAVEAE